VSTTKKTTEPNDITIEPAATVEPIIPNPTRFGNKAVDRKSLKTHRLNGLTFCSFSVTVKAGSTGGDVAIQKLRNIQTIIATPVGAPLQGLSWYVTKNIVSINYEPSTIDKQVINFVVIGQR